jgi:hypothetical protein
MGSETSSYRPIASGSQAVTRDRIPIRGDGITPVCPAESKDDRVHWAMFVRKDMLILSQAFSSCQSGVHNSSQQTLIHITKAQQATLHQLADIKCSLNASQLVSKLIYHNCAM